MTDHILIVGDDTDFRYSACIALKRSGYRVVDMASGLEALSLVRSKMYGGFDLLLLDILLPEMSGMELVEELNKIGNPVPIFVVSGLADENLVSELMSRGCADFLHKPFEPREMIRRVECILRQKNSGRGKVESDPLATVMSPDNQVRLKQ